MYMIHSSFIWRPWEGYHPFSEICSTVWRQFPKQTNVVSAIPVDADKFEKNYRDNNCSGTFSRTCFRFSGQTSSSNCFVLLTITTIKYNNGYSALVWVNCEKMVVGSVFLNDIKKLLSQYRASEWVWKWPRVHYIYNHQLYIKYVQDYIVVVCFFFLRTCLRIVLYLLHLFINFFLYFIFFQILMLLIIINIIITNLFIYIIHIIIDYS